MDTSFIFYLVAGLLVIVGIAGVVLPALPGVPLVFAGLLLAAWVDGFAHVSWVALLVLGALTLLSVVVDIASSALGAKGLGASRLAMAGALLGSLLGLLFLPWGVLIGPFLGALGGEYLHSRRLGLATKVGLATFLGLVIAVALKLGLVMTMLGIFALAWWW